MLAIYEVGPEKLSRLTPDNYPITSPATWVYNSLFDECRWR
jgi:hypothetical protein